ncbi:MAG: neutral/alkaline non-lysosomal ceramidase N-terminal domain-containing protein [Halobacteriales archaeon]
MYDAGRPTSLLEREAGLTGTLKAGAASVDVTPDVGRSMEGYVRPDIKSTGVASRLHARALALERGDSRVCLVSADVWSGTRKRELVDRVRDLGLNADDLVFAGTHTHAATYVDGWTVPRVAEAVRRAFESLGPAELGWSRVEVDGVNRNRSIEAHLANHGVEVEPGEGAPDMDPEGEDHPRDLDLRALRVDGVDGPLAAWFHYPVHPTVYPPSNTFYSSDVAGAALHRFRERLREDGVTPPVTGWASEASGDLIPRYPGSTAHAACDALARRLGSAMEKAWSEAGEDTSAEVDVGSRSLTEEYRGQEVEGKRMASRGVFGLAFLAGGENGPSPFRGLGLEGRRRPRFLSRGVHGRKIPVAPTPWGNDVELQVVRVGDVVVACVPGEPTVEVGRRIRRDVESAVDVDDVSVIGLSNAYRGYFTTPEEYDRQHYEGGHTVYGRHSEALVRDGLRRAARTLESDERSRRSTASPDAGTPLSSTPAGASEGAIRRQPPAACERPGVVEFRWKGGRRGRDMPLDDDFVSLELDTGDGWRSVATDRDTGFVWTVEGETYFARYDLPFDHPTGSHRFAVTARDYALRSREFEVTASSDLRVRGAVSCDGGVELRVQYPAPTEELRRRRRRPRSGEVVFQFDGEHTASYESPGRYVADVDVEEGDVVVVPEDGARDGLGNSSGDAVEVAVGDVDPLDWPSDMEVGGGRPPGPFNRGSFPLSR